MHAGDRKVGRFSANPFVIKLLIPPAAHLTVHKQIEIAQKPIFLAGRHDADDIDGKRRRRAASDYEAPMASKINLLSQQISDG